MTFATGRMKRFTLMVLAGFLALAFWTGAVAAQDNEVITATVDRTALTTDDLLTLTVTVDRAAGATEPILPALDGFSLLGTSSGTQISIINGDMSVQMAYTYYLQPTQAGDLIINPFTTTANGQTYQTEPILIKVAQGTGQFQPSIPSPGFGNLIPNLPNIPAPNQAPPTADGTLPAPAGLNGQDYYVEAIVDNNNPWQGEQVLYAFRFYQGSSLLVEPNFQPPEFTGFWHDRQAEQTTYTTEAAGRTYYVTEIQTVLFPTVSGDVTIGPATLEIPGGFFSNGQTLTTDPVPVSIKPLPDNPPAGFQGAVGQFGLQSLVDKTTSQVNDAVTLQVTLSGIGNIDTLADLTWDVGPEWRAFDAQVESTSTFANGQLQGSRIYEQLLVPLVPGSLTVEPITFSYFDPQIGDYTTIATQPIVVQVSADPNARPIDPGRGCRRRPGRRCAWLAADEGHSQFLAGCVRRQFYAGYAGREVGLLGAICCAPTDAGGADWLWGRHQLPPGDGGRTAEVARRAQAYDSLDKARKQPETAAASGARVLNTYLTTKLEQPTVGLTRDALGDLLRSRDLNDDLVSRVQNCLQDSDTAAYFPGFSAAGANAHSRRSGGDNPPTG